MKMRPLGVRVGVSARAFALAAMTFTVLSFVGVDVVSATPAAGASPSSNPPVSCAGSTDSAGCTSSGSLPVQQGAPPTTSVAPTPNPTTVDGAGQATNSANPTSVPTAAPLGTDTASPPVTQPPANQPPANQPPANQPPANQPPANQPPANQPPANQPPANQPPANQPPANQPPANQPPANQPPANQPPALPAISIHKTANPTTVTAAGQTVTYTYAIENTGNVTLHNVGVTDAQAPPSLGSSLGPITCATGTNGSITLWPQATDSCSATYTVTQADMDNGSITDVGTARGTPPNSNKPVCATSTATVNATQSPGISVVKTASLPAVSAVGQIVTYTFTITNTGNVTLDNVNVSDAQSTPSLGSSVGPITCATGINGDIILAPGATDTCSATYTVTQADLANNSIKDTATATGTPPNSTTPVTGTSTLTLLVTKVSVTKSASPAGGVVAGSNVPIVYTITVSNTGSATTTAPIVITDSAPTGTTLVSNSPACVTGGPPTCSVSVDSTGIIRWTVPPGVAPGASYTLSFSVTANASDATGSITNTAIWSGPSCGSPASTTTTCPTNTVMTPVTAPPTTTPVALTSTPTTTTSPPPSATPPSATTPIAFTGAPLSEEWTVGLGALWLGACLVVFARWRRRPRGAASKG